METSPGHRGRATRSHANLEENAEGIILEAAEVEARLMDSAGLVPASVTLYMRRRETEEKLAEHRQSARQLEHLTTLLSRRVARVKRETLKED